MTHPITSGAGGDKPVNRPAVRRSESGDAEPLAMLMTELGYPSDARAMKDRLVVLLDRPDHAGFVAETDGNVVGMVAACVLPVWHADAPAGWIISLVVAERARGSGTGRALVAAAEDWLARQGARSVTVTSNVQRAGAHAFYRKIGYTQTGLRFARALEV